MKTKMREELIDIVLSSRGSCRSVRYIHHWPTPDLVEAARIADLWRFKQALKKYPSLRRYRRKKIKIIVY